MQQVGPEFAGGFELWDRRLKLGPVASSGLIRKFRVNLLILRLENENNGVVSDKQDGIDKVCDIRLALRKCQLFVPVTRKKLFFFFKAIIFFSNLHLEKVTKGSDFYCFVFMC